MTIVDLSRYQGVLPVSVFQQFRAAGVTRAILKVGGGDSGRYEDSCFAGNAANAAAAGMPFDGYWFNGTTDPATDARFAAGIVGPSCRLWWDAESEGTMPHWSPAQVKAAHDAIGNRQGIYMSQSVTFEPGWELVNFLPLWEAAYYGTTPPAVGGGFRVVLWQSTSTGHLPGYGGNLDLSQELPAFAALSATTIPAPAPQPEEDDVAKPRFIQIQQPGDALNGQTHFLFPDRDIWVEDAPSGTMPTQIAPGQVRASLADLTRGWGLRTPAQNWTDVVDKVSKAELIATQTEINIARTQLRAELVAAVK